ncbi:unnamed protein product [Spirodela intermedia]|uniref:DUF6821 domain-containing protein n=1 Tax=Spirodela intermedia TaxID=51605 RepID=A0A7I8J3F1_SPIIN|nr:unnamed protein product [Spirodela intermedia]CAA6663921.1 unnamed protein product [Spirodela intermedia]
MPWWKLPVELLKFCVFRIRPVWSVSIAAALVSLVLLRRRLYKKKPKIKSVPINLSADDKKASQFMVRASRLNEAFSVVKRIPMIRSTLPTMGVTPWPVMALR